MIVKDVIRPGHELYGEPEGADADPLPILKSVMPTSKETVLKNIFGF